MKQPIFLRVFLHDKLENVVQFSEEQVVIGRNTDLQLPLPSEGVGPIHASIEERDSGYYISDLGSPFGTFKNGQKIFDEQLATGDELQIGPYKIEFYIGVPKPKGAPKAGAVTPAVPPSELPKDVPQVKKPSIPITPATGTFAPPDQTSGLTKRMTKSHGNMIEVVVAWGERVVTTHHFTQKGDVTIGSDPNNNIVMPLPGTKVNSHLLLIIKENLHVCLSPDMVGDYFKGDTSVSFSELVRKGRVVQTPSGPVLELFSGEMVRVQVGGLLNIFVRFVPETAKPIASPLFNMTNSERTGLIMSAAVSLFFALILFLYSPNPLQDKENVEEPLRRAKIIFNIPKPQPVTDDLPQKKKIVNVVSTKQTTTRRNNGQAGGVRSKPTKKKVKKVTSAVNKGGSVKTKKRGANAKTKKRDVRNEGLLAVFGSKGRNKKLNQAYSGTGELQGMADSATGYAGSKEGRAGDNLGSRVKNVGAGGKGSSNVGYSGIGTKGKGGTGTFGYGTGGIGKKGKEDINIEGVDAEFTGSIDRDAIRRVIQQNRRAFKYCYNLALRRNSDLYGKIQIQWDIVEKGRVQNAFVKSNSMGDKVLGNCIVKKIRGLTFPEPPADQVARVVYPFVFAAQ